MQCLICNFSEADLKRFSNHLKSVHSLTSYDYTVEHIHRGTRPLCLECQSETRYCAFEFKRYCSDHAKLAMSVSGKIGGKAEAWNKGKTKETDGRVAAYAASVLGEGNHFYGRSHSLETIRKISETKRLGSIDIEERILERSSELRLLTPLSDYFSRQMQYLKFQCVKCETVQSKTLQAFERGSRCYVCFPNSKSNWEFEVLNFVKKHCPDVVSGDRSVLSPKEIDIYVPSKRFGIECHGLYWHSDGSSRGEDDKQSTLKKIELANAKYVRLIQIFDDEWRDKREICESMILHKLGMTKQRIHARKCDVVRVTTRQQREFFDKSHLSGYTPASKAIGLTYEDRLVAVLSLRKPRNENKYRDMLEVARFATLPGIAVIGGLNKLMSKIEGKIMTYVDRRTGTGEGYQQCGFKMTGKTGVDYWYTDNVLRYDRFKYRAQEGKPEKIVASEAGVSKVWGCGSFVFERAKIKS